MSALIAHVPFECPNCGRNYHIELDLVKLTRLKRVAECGRCHNKFTVAIHVQPIEQPAEQPVDPPLDQPIEQPVDQPVEQPVELPVELPVEQPVEQPVRHEVYKRTDPDVLSAPEERSRTMKRARTLKDISRNLPPTPAAVENAVETQIIVEVGGPSSSAPKKRKAYRTDQLTQKGLGPIKRR